MKGRKRPRLGNLSRQCQKSLARDIKEKQKEARARGQKIVFHHEPGIGDLGR